MIIKQAAPNMIFFNSKKIYL